MEELSQDVAFCASTRAVRELDEGNRIVASFYVDRLVEALQRLLSRPKELRLPPPWKDRRRVGSLLYVGNLRINRKAFVAAVQNSGDRANEFGKHLSTLAESLSVNMTEKEYTKMQESLHWLVAQSKQYEDSTVDLLERHPKVKAIAQALPFLASIAAIVMGST